MRVDSSFSLEPEEFRRLGEETERAWLALGRVTYGGTAAEAKSRVFRRTLYVARDVKAGEALTRDNLRIVRPGFGLPPKYFDTLLGKRVNRDVAAGKWAPPPPPHLLGERPGGGGWRRQACPGLSSFF